MLYRALEGTNTRTRRLAYLTAILSILGRGSLSEQSLLAKIARWGEDHKKWLEDYWVKTGEVSSTSRNSRGISRDARRTTVKTGEASSTRRTAAGARYLHLAASLGLTAPISGAYRATRAGLVLFALVEEKGTNPNPFFLTHTERLFYLYLLFDQDADLLLAVTDYLDKHSGASLAQTQRDFQEAFLHRLSQKIIVCRDDAVRQTLLERRHEVERWKKPERYAEHIVPPRLNWLLDLDFLEPGQFRQHRYFLTLTGRKFLSALPQGNIELRDVSGDWLDSDFWMAAACTLPSMETLTRWDAVDDKTRREVCTPLLKAAFRAFRHTTVPKVSLKQALLYLSVRLLLEQHVGANPASLTKWLAVPQTLDGRRYEVHFSPRENESYLVVMSA